MVLGVQHGVAAEHGHAVLPALGALGGRGEVVDRREEDPHAELLGERAGLVGEVAALTPADVDLLQPDDVGAQVAQGGGGAVEVEDLVRPRTRVDVVRRHAERHGGGAGAGRGGRGGVLRRRGRGRGQRQDGGDEDGGDTGGAGGASGSLWHAFSCLRMRC
ncbi:hypothetical protein GA0115245_135115 [Streptomyces sp. di188]|nr:hypothetical protein GA0115245_135115 [Streptomyces sp. di188]